MLQYAQMGTFCNTFDLHYAIICHYDLCFVIFEWPLNAGILSSSPISVLCHLELEAKSFTIEQTNNIKQHFLQGVMFNISIVLISILRSTISDILSKFHS